LRVLILSGVGAVVGLATGWAAWFVAGGPGAAVAKVEPVIASLGALRLPTQVEGPPTLAGEDAPGRPLFQLTTGPDAVREPTLRLDGLAVTRSRAAALLSIDGKPAAWLAEGEARDGVTLTRLTRDAAVIDTLVGTHSLALGESYPSSAGPQIANAGRPNLPGAH